jgi:hypothetical protein
MNIPLPAWPLASTEAAIASRRQLAQQLQQQMAGVGRGNFRQQSAQAGWVSTGCAALDGCLPQAVGFRRGSLVEWFAAGPGDGAGSLALLVARQACLSGGALVVVDPARRFYPPAAAACGIDLRRLVIIRPERPGDLLWAWDQALRSPAVKAVWGWLEAVNDRWFRRFQLAAERSGCLGLFLRPAKYRGDPSWSAVQLAVSGRSSVSHGGQYLRVELVRCRGLSVSGLQAGAGFLPGRGHGGVDLKLEECHGQLQVIEVSEHETPALHLVSELAHPTSAGGSAGS